ncbi:unnamed protein product, partial [Mesorhabditis belari]|uniref:procollagen-lysine 5-dioxygenase n=1 Tax=Mesorhabditis belari TaxID=2138241 RepID=A0AAF3J650_9BILA
MRLIGLILPITFSIIGCLAVDEPPEVIVVTVATEETDGLKRLIRSAESFDIKVHVFGLGEEWKGGDTRVEQGGGQKINILKRELAKWKDEKNKMIMFVDAYDVLFTASMDTVIQHYFQHFSDHRILFGAEPYCWPNPELAVEYPLVSFGKRFLNSGLYLGYAADIYKMLTLKEVKDSDDDQLYFTLVYLDEKLRKDLKIGLDSISRIFQNLNGVSDDVELQFDEENGQGLAYNANYNTHPVIIHGNGPSKRHLDYLGNYVAHRWNSMTGCGFCSDRSHLDLQKADPSAFPLVTLAIFVPRPIPFLEEFLEAILKLDYPKDRLALFIYNNQRFSIQTIFDFVNKNAGGFYTKKIINGVDRTEREARQMAIEFHKLTGSDFFFSVDSDVMLTNPKTLQHLIEDAVNYDVGIVAPMVLQPEKVFSNFWGAIASNGYYARSEDYMAIVKGNRVGFWQMPYVSGALLLKKEKLSQMETPFDYQKIVDPDMSFCAYARDRGHFMHVTNEVAFGFLIVADEFPEHIKAGYKHPEMWEIFENKMLWEERYLHPKYKETLAADLVPQACPDVYDYALMSERYCADMIDEMETFGQWSDGSHSDNRLTGGYENVPTRDIHMNQIGYERHWLYFMNEYVRPMQEKVFIGYFQNPVYSNMMFVVRYRPDEQASLRPHHDASTYSIDIALNKKDRDYEGGGVRYVRYNCTVPADEIGYTMMFPGRLTHMHEGLPTTSGTRYILVSFINP